MAKMANPTKIAAYICIASITALAGILLRTGFDAEGYQRAIRERDSLEVELHQTRERLAATDSVADEHADLLECIQTAGEWDCNLPGCIAMKRLIKEQSK